jgi:hypothetical protein
MKRNLNELEKNMNKYSELLNNILNFQGMCSQYNFINFI